MLPTARFLIALATASATAGNLAAQQRVNLPAKDTPLTLATRPLFEVGELDGEEYETFANVIDVAFDQAGNLYVLDATAYRVIVFDPQGRFLRTIGRQGDGPGEFGFPAALAVLPNGELVVNDAMKSNLQIFGPDGAFRRTVVLPEDLGRASGRMRNSPAGGVITETMQLRRMIEGADRAQAQQIQMPPRVVTRLTIGDSATGTKLFTAPPRSLAMTAPKAANNGKMRVSMSMTAFEPSLLWAPVAGGIAALNTAAYRITLTDGQGRAVRYLERPIAPRKVTNADKKRFLENQKKGGGGGVGGGVAVVAIGSHVASTGSGQARPSASSTMRISGADIKEEDITWSELIPVVNALGTDSFGRLWVQRTASDLGPGPIDVIAASGRYLGTLAKQEMPRAFGPGGRIAYVTKDDMDVQRVVVKQLQR